VIDIQTLDKEQLIKRLQSQELQIQQLRMAIVCVQELINNSDGVFSLGIEFNENKV